MKNNPINMLPDLKGGDISRVFDKARDIRQHQLHIIQENVRRRFEYNDAVLRFVSSAYQVHKASISLVEKLQTGGALGVDKEHLILQNSVSDYHSACAQMEAACPQPEDAEDVFHLFMGALTAVQMENEQAATDASGGPSEDDLAVDLADVL